MNKPIEYVITRNKFGDFYLVPSNLESDFIMGFNYDTYTIPDYARELTPNATNIIITEFRII